MMNSWVLWMLKPVALILELFLGVPFTYYEGVGFVNTELNINIAKECSGINFFIMVLLMLMGSFCLKIRGKKNRWMAILGVIVYGYIIAILANASRIIGTIFIMNLGLISNSKQYILIHQSIGVVFYLVYLMFSYFVFYKIINKMEAYHEESV